MTRRITCYVVFVTLIWGAHTEDEENVRAMFKSNLTRNDFSNLLQSLIKLNEQRVSVLQKLYRLEDYGVLSEVLRASDKKTGNGNPNNLFLIVMSKNPNDPSRRKVEFQVVDPVTSLDVGNNNIHPKLDFVLDPAGYIFQNIRKENRLESIFGNVPRVYEPTKTHRAGDEIKKIITTTKTRNYGKPGLRTEVKHDILKPSLKANEDRKHHKENSRFKIVGNKGRRHNASEKLLHYAGNSNKYSQTVGYNSQSNEYHEIDFTIQNDQLTTKPIIIKDILSSNHKNSKYHLEGKDELDEDDYGSPFSNNKNNHNSQYTNINSDVSIKKLRDINNHNSKLNKNTKNVKVQSNQPPKLNRYKFKLNNQGIKHSKVKTPIQTTTRKNEYKTDGIVNKASVRNKGRRPNASEKLLNYDGNSNKYPQTVGYNSQSNEYHEKDFTIENNKVTTKPIIIKDILSSNHKNYKYPLKGKDELGEDDYGSPFSNIENDHNSQYTNINSDVSIKKLYDINNPKTGIYKPYGSYPGLEHLKDVRDNSNKDKPKTAKDTPIGNYPGFEHHKYVRDNYNRHKLKTTIGPPFGNFHGFEHHKNLMDNMAKDLPYGDNLNAESIKDTDYDGIKMFDNGKKSVEKFSVLITNVRNGPAEEVKQQNAPKLILTSFDQPESKPIARQPFVKCLNKKALKLCRKSCIRAYKNVCRRLKCTSRSKKALKSECKRSCKKIFASTSSKYSNENSDECSDENSDESYSDNDYS